MKWSIKKIYRKETFLLVSFLFLLAGVKAQQSKIKNTEVIEYRKGNSPEWKEQQKQVKNETQAVPKPLDSVRSSAKMKTVKENKTISKPIYSPINGSSSKTSDRKADSLLDFIKAKVSTKTPQQTTNKPATKQAAKRGE